MTRYADRRFRHVGRIKKAWGTDRVSVTSIADVRLCAKHFRLVELIRLSAEKKREAVA